MLLGSGNIISSCLVCANLVVRLIDAIDHQRYGMLVLTSFIISPCLVCANLVVRLIDHQRYGMLVLTSFIVTVRTILGYCVIVSLMVT